MISQSPFGCGLAGNSAIIPVFGGFEYVSSSTSAERNRLGDLRGALRSAFEAIARKGEAVSRGTGGKKRNTSENTIQMGIGKLRACNRQISRACRRPWNQGSDAITRGLTYFSKYFSKKRNYLLTIPFFENTISPCGSKPTKSRGGAFLPAFRGVTLGGSRFFI